MRSVLESGIATGSIFALVLNAVVPKAAKKSEPVEVEELNAEEIAMEAE